MNINCILQHSAVFFYAEHIQVKRCSEQATGWTTDGSQLTSQPGQEFLSQLRSAQTSSMTHPVSSTVDIKGTILHKNYENT